MIPVATWIVVLLAVSACNTKPQPFTYQVRVEAKAASEYLPETKVTIEVGGKAPLDAVTDVNGLGRIPIPAEYAGQPAVLIVEAAGYQRYRQNVDLVEDALPQVVQLEASRPVASTQITLEASRPVTLTQITLTPTPTPTETSTPTSTPSPTRTAWITYPVAGSQVAQFTTVTGEYSPGLTDDLWVFVQERTGRFFPATMFLHQEQNDCRAEGAIKRDGKWEMPVILGDSNSVDQPLNIILAAANPTVSQSISISQTNFCLQKRFPGLEKLPNGLTILQRIRVTRSPDIGGPLPDVLDAQLPVTGEVSDINITDQSEIPQTTWITGTQTGVTGNLWVLVYVYNGRWYPQSIIPCLGEAARTEGDKWWTKVSFGGPQDRGRPFDVLVVQTDTDANRAFEDVQVEGCRVDYYQGLRTLQLPKGIAVMSHLRVYGR